MIKSDFPGQKSAHTGPESFFRFRTSHNCSNRKEPSEGTVFLQQAIYAVRGEIQPKGTKWGDKHAVRVAVANDHERATANDRDITDSCPRL